MGSIESNLLIGGFGINDSDTPIRISENINGKSTILWTCPHYQKWTYLISRCTNGKKECYDDISICEEWKYFSNFKSWSTSQPFFSSELCLDKDILSGTIYSPETCRYVPMYINNLIIAKSTNDYMLGVTYDKSRNRFKSNISINGINRNSPRFQTEFEAHQWWQTEKISYMTMKLNEYQQSEYYISEIFDSINQRIENINNDLSNNKQTLNLRLY